MTVVLIFRYWGFGKKQGSSTSLREATLCYREAGEQGSRGAGEQGSRGAGEQGSRGAGEQGSR
ncbi:hypothetical protein, partial [Nostoc sp.]|uniref:hypothetical protein n=1 Tax=Nostoc sp. TaxID=1180 RepID=UPI002FFD06B6